ncbi:MAG: hypothetical protein E6F98_00255 [Actinobacteria bacterium]|nr:MAG: hypothetical protein E6F98_00255 [Actinomycetota bacterium]
MTYLRGLDHTREQPPEGRTSGDRVDELRRHRGIDGPRQRPAERGIVERSRNEFLQPPGGFIRRSRPEPRDDEPLDDAVLDERAAEPLGNRSRHDPVDRTLGLVGERTSPGLRHRVQRLKRPSTHPAGQARAVSIAA